MRFFQCISVSRPHDSHVNRPGILFNALGLGRADRAALEGGPGRLTFARRSCMVKCQNGKLFQKASAEAIRRFSALVDRSAGPDACHPWTGPVDSAGVKGGYGKTCIAGLPQGPHRAACELTHGPAPVAGLEACHSRACTTRLCCNGRHLRWDTHAGNHADAAALGSRKGEKNPKAVLVPDQVLQIWSRRADGPGPISRDLGLSLNAIKGIVRGSTWRHLTGGLPLPAVAGEGAVL